MQKIRKKKKWKINFEGYNKSCIFLKELFIEHKVENGGFEGRADKKKSEILENFDRIF